jgi:hypothetical protein
VGVMVEYLQFWEVLLNVELEPGHQDTHYWRFTTNKKYSAKVAYEGLFWGQLNLSIMNGSGRLGLQQSVGIFYG